MDGPNIYIIEEGDDPLTRQIYGSVAHSCLSSEGVLFARRVEQDRFRR